MPNKYLPEREFYYNQKYFKYCNKLNHSEEQCWIKYPNKRPSNKFHQRDYQYYQGPPYPSKTGYSEYSYENAYLNLERLDNRQCYPTVSYRERENYNPRGKVTNDRTANMNNPQHNISPYDYKNNRNDF